MRQATSLLLFLFAIAWTISCGGIGPKNVSIEDHGDRAKEYNEKKEYDKAIEECNAAIREHDNFPSPELADIYNARAIAYEGKKAYDKAVADYEEAIKIDPEAAHAHNNLAWLLATCPQDNIRNGQKALGHAHKVHELDEEDADYMGTLGAAYAETGQFEEAIKWEKKALEDAGYREEHGKVGEECLKLYQHANLTER